MSYEESNERKRSRRGFRTPLDIGMGLIYTVIGGMIMIFKSFGNMPINPILAYLLGGMMVVGGGSRLYRGMKDVLQK